MRFKGAFVRNEVFITPAFVITTEGSWDKPDKKYCENCGAKMDEEDKKQ